MAKKTTLQEKTAKRDLRGEKNPFYGKHHTEETKRRILETRKSNGGVAWNKGKKMDEEYRSRCRINNLGKKLSPETKLKIKEKSTGRRPSEETRQKISLAHRGKIISTESKLKMRERAIERWKKEEYRTMQKLKNYRNRGRKFTTSHKNKIRIALRGNVNGWKGGLSFLPYPPTFNNEFKNLVRLRDNFCCLNCGISEQKHLILFGKKLAIHHIDYIKENTCLQNCCAACNNCNLLANTKREYWKEFYQNKLSERYGYKYDLDRKDAEVLINGNK